MMSGATFPTMYLPWVSVRSLGRASWAARLMRNVRQVKSGQAGISHRAMGRAQVAQVTSPGIGQVRGGEMNLTYLAKGDGGKLLRGGN